MNSELLLRYVAGEATAEESAAVDAWASAAPQNAQELRIISAALRVAMSPTDEHAAPAPQWDRIASRLHGATPALPAETVPPRASTALPRATTSPPHAPASLPRAATWLLRAAAISLLLAGGLLFALRRDTPSALVATAAATHATGVGDTRLIHLPDGTQAVLGPYSTLTIPAGFGDAQRQLELNGTAHFDVVHDTGRPFIVVAGAVSATVLGTEFVVRAYADDDAVDVAVVEGRVSVRAATEVEVAAGESAHVEGGVIRLGRDEAAPLLAWREGRLHFRDTILRHAARELERWYDVDIIVADERLQQRRLSMSMQAGPLDEVLALLQASLGVRVERTNGQVRFVP
jgi:transmembrane sensor